MNLKMCKNNPEKTDNQTQRLEVQFIQPWSNIIAKVKLPDDIFKEFSSLYDTVMKDEELKLW